MAGVTTIDEVLQANVGYPERYPAGRAAAPARALAIVTCMDARIDAFAAFGLAVGDAHVLRNAGGLPTEDALRSLAISQRALGTREVLLVQHTRCGLSGFDDAAFRAQLARETGRAPTWDVPGFDDVVASVRASVATVRACPWLPHRDAVRGAVFDVDAGTVTAVD